MVDYDFNEEDIIQSDKFLSIIDNSISLIKTDVLLNGPMIWRDSYHEFKPSYILITSHSDYGITENIFNIYSKYCNTWFTINKEFKHPKLRSFPLGITNYCDDSNLHKIYGDTNIMVKVKNKQRIIKNIAYINFNIDSHISRHTIYSTFSNKNWVTVCKSNNTLEGRQKYLEDIRNHLFVFCPRGNGVDTHRLWETLYMGSIPICERNTALDEFNDLPICWVNNWNEVTVNFLYQNFKEINNKYWNMNKLKITYWIQKIKSCLLEYPSILSVKKNNTAFILTHLGLGDNICCLGIIKYLNKYYDIIYYVVKKHNTNTVKTLLSNMNNIIIYEVDDDKEISIKSGYSIDKFNQITNGMDVFLSGVHSNNFYESTMFPLSFYDQVNIPREYFWNIEISLIDSAHKLYEKLISFIGSDSYIFIHNHTSEGTLFDPYIILEKLNINFDKILVIITNKNIYNIDHKFYNIAKQFINKDILDYTIIIQQAYYKIMSDSSFFCLTHFLDCKTTFNYVITRGFDYSHLYNENNYKINIIKNKFTRLFI